MSEPKGRRKPTLLGTVLKDYRKARKLTQEALAADLGIDPRMLRHYESGSRDIESIRELRRISDLLVIDPARLGLATSGEVPRSPEEIEAVVEHAWRLIDRSQIGEARLIIERLLPSLQARAPGDSLLLRALARTYHAAGYVIAVNSRSFDAYKAIPFYQQMELIARELGDDTLTNIALTYQGDMYSRSGNPEQALIILRAARDTTPGADAASLGNGIQLLGRAALRTGDLGTFADAMDRAEALTYEFEPMTAVTRGHYNLGTVLEEWGRGYAQLGQLDKALGYLDRAQLALPQTIFWGQVLDTARALALVHGGEVRAGVELARVAAISCMETGNIRMLDRVTMIEHYLDRLAREFTQYSGGLRDVLGGNRDAEF